MTARTAALLMPKPERDRPHQHPHFVRHPAFLVPAPLVGVHLAVIADRRNAMLLEHVHRFFHAGDGGRIHNDVALGVILQSARTRS